MKLKRKITQTELEQLAEPLQALYSKVGDDFILQVEDTAFETLKAEKKKAEDELKKYQDEEADRIKKAEERAEQKAKEKYEKAKTDKDVEAIENSWSEKYNKLQAEKEELNAKHTDYVKKALIETAVAKMASEISTSPTLISPHIRSRLDVDFSGEAPKLIVLDANGQRSAQTLQELQKSFVDNKDFSAIIKVTSATGGAKAGGLSSGTQNDEKPKRLGDLTDEQLAQIAKEMQANSEE